MRIGAAALCAVTLLGMPAIAPAVTIDTDGRLVIAADDGTFAARISGRVHADANFYGSGVVD
ncbi:MAG: hypothetical protein ACPGE9_05470, partial [Algiphilus sp.]